MKKEYDFSTQAHPWMQGALSWMKNHPNPDGTIGVILKDGAAAHNWHRYFLSKNMKQSAGVLRSFILEERPYLAPTEWPDEYDYKWKRMPNLGFMFPKNTQTAEERAAAVDRYWKILTQGGS
jgi:hypothetical protein